MSTILDVRPAHRDAIDASIGVVERVEPGDLGRPTPCSEWTVSDLLGHMTAQHRGFAAAARGRGGDLAAWELVAVADPVAAYVAAAQDVLDAFAGDGVLERRFLLPEISTRVTFPGARAIGFHLIDYVAHGWDVARAIDAPFPVDADTVGVALALAMQVPDDDSRTSPRALFAPAVAARGASTDLDRFLTHLGRRPSWPD